ncbi:MAG: redoxin domain-containing protein [Verrucomicrobiaceae bacterium]|nr:redoxin domain-containing protein [Verrucomicrobiaceae bacterium]
MLRSFRLLSLLTIVACSHACIAVTIDEAMEMLTSARSTEQIEAAAAKARRAGITNQRIAEAKMLFGIKTQDAAYLKMLLPDLEIIAQKFEQQPSLAGIRTVEQWRGLVSYTEAMVSMEQRNQDKFREHITDAIWNFPQQAELFGQAIEKFQLQQKMDMWVIDFSTPLIEAGASETTLGALIGSKKALLLFFWSSNVEASVQTLEAAEKLYHHLRGSNIVVATVNVGTTEAESTTEKVRDEKKLTLPCLVESSQRVLVRQMEITSLPRAILITQQGRVIFHGHPMDDSIWKSLKRVVPTVTSLGE